MSPFEQVVVVVSSPSNERSRKAREVMLF